MTISDKAERSRKASRGWMIQRIAGRLDQVMDQRLAAHDLTVQQFAILMSVLEVEGRSQTEIGQRFRAPAYAISRAIDQLEKSGYLERKPHPTSRRTHMIFPSEKGRKLSQTLFAIVGDVNAELTASLSEEETIRFSQILEKLMANFVQAR